MIFYLSYRFLFCYSDLMRYLFQILLIFSISLFGGIYEEKTEVLYNSLDPTSLSELFAFYHLYPQTPSGEKAHRYAWELIRKHRKISIEPTHLMQFALHVFFQILGFFSQQSCGSFIHNNNVFNFLFS